MIKITKPVAAGLVLGSALAISPSAADAHNSNDTEGGWHYRTDDLCVYGGNQFNHDVQTVEVGSYKAYSYFGAYKASCQSGYTRPAGSLAAKAEWRKSGSLCAYSDWVYSSSSGQGMQVVFRNQKCGEGVVAMKGFHYVNHSGWYGGAINGPSHDNSQK